MTSRSRLGAEREICLIHRSATTRCSSTAKNAFTANVKLPEKPIEAELLKIILRDLDEFGLDLYLLRSRDARLLDQRIHQFEIILSVAHDEPAALRQEVRARPRRKLNALRLEKIFRGFPIHELAPAGGFLRILTACRLQRGRPALDHARARSDRGLI